MELQEQLESKKFKGKGYKINVYQDVDAESPQEWDDDVFIVAYHRDFTVSNDATDKNQLSRIFRNEYDPEDESEQELKEMDEDLQEKYFIFWLEAYIHSGVVLAIRNEGNFPDRQWDVSTVGAVLIKKNEYYKTEEEARKRADMLINSWNHYLSGDIYGHMIERPNYEGEESGCWGFYGTDYEKNGLLEHAEEDIEEIIEREEAQEAEEKTRLEGDKESLRTDIRELGNKMMDRLRPYKADNKLKTALRRNIKSILAILE